jgi:hypothetical protein
MLHTDYSRIADRYDDKPRAFAEAKNRAIARLDLISQAEYEEGLWKMTSAAQTGGKLEGDFSSLTVTCEKRSV